MKQLGKKTWLDLTQRYRKGFLVWGICLLLFGIVTFLSWWSRHDLYDQQAAKRWSEQNDFAQLSCFYPVTVQPTEFDFQSLYHTIEEELKNASMETDTEVARLFVDAYSVTGALTLSTDNGTMEVKAVGVTDDFFLFHPVTLLQGSYFDENMLMKDGVILDEDAAFTLYGSNDVVGMPVYVGNQPFYIRGVVERGDGHFEKAAGLQTSLCYVPVQTLLETGSIEGSYTYEVLMPNPVDGFARDILEKALKDTKNQLEIVENSLRFGADNRKEILFDFGTRSMSSKAIIYPYWENVARAKEDISAAFYLVQYITCILVFMLTIFYIWYRFKNRTVGMKTFVDFISRFMEKLRMKRQQVKPEE